MNTKRLLELLNHRHLPHEAQVEVWAAGQDGLEQVYALLREGRTTDLRLQNAIPLAFAVRHLGDPSAFFELLIQTTLHPRIRVRSTAAKYLLAYVIRNQRSGPEDQYPIVREAAIESLRRALDMGLGKDATNLLNDFFQKSEET